MAKNTSIALGDHFHDFVDEKVKEGRFGSVSEVVRAGLRLLEEREGKVEALKRAIEEGLASGPSRAFDFDAFMKQRRSPKKRKSG